MSSINMHTAYAKFISCFERNPQDIYRSRFQQIVGNIPRKLHLNGFHDIFVKPLKMQLQAISSLSAHLDGEMT